MPGWKRAFAGPHQHVAAITEVASALSALLQATQAAAALVAAPPAGAQPLPEGPLVKLVQVVGQAASPPAQVVTQLEADGDSDQAMGSEGEGRETSTDPADPRPPPPAAKKPRCGDAHELIIAT